MDLVLYSDDGALEALMRESAPSPEEFLLMLEDAIASGELSPTELFIYINDFNDRKKRIGGGT